MQRNLFILICGVVIITLCSNINCKTSKVLQRGDMAPEWSPMKWWNSDSLSLKNLKGKIVLIRWWTNGCQYCIQSAEALNDWYSTYRDSGFIVVGMYHPKPFPRELESNEVYFYLREKEFLFPIAEDAQWVNLTNYWLHSGNKEYTSVSFLLDQNGIIRWIHPGGEYHKNAEIGHESCLRDYLSLDSAIVALLRE